MSAIGRPNQRGFTLIEALVVVAIAGLIAGLAFPRIDRAIHRQQFRTNEAALVQGIRLARATAIRTSTTTRFSLLGTGDQFAIDNVAQPPLAKGMRIAAIDRPSLRFFADGSSDGGRYTLIDRELRADITVYPSTGVVTLAAPQ